MPGPRQLVFAVWVLSGLATLGSIGAWVTAVPRLSHQRWSPPATSIMPETRDTIGLAAAAARLRGANPFRLDRRPASVPFDPWALSGAASAAPRPAPARPALTLAGIVGGPPWRVLIEGIPGRETGIVLTAGEVVGGIRLILVSGDTARLSGYDTTWVLTTRRVLP